MNELERSKMEAEKNKAFERGIENDNRLHFKKPGEQRVGGKKRPERCGTESEHQSLHNAGWEKRILNRVTGKTEREHRKVWEVCRPGDAKGRQGEEGEQAVEHISV